VLSFTWLISSSNYCISASKFEQPFMIGMLIRGLLEDDNPRMVYSEGMHNRSRLLRCSHDKVNTIKLFLSEKIWIIFTCYFPMNFYNNCFLIMHWLSWILKHYWCISNNFLVRYVCEMSLHHIISILHCCHWEFIIKINIYMINFWFYSLF
jgi:hypothetical protein